MGKGSSRYWPSLPFLRLTLVFANVNNVFFTKMSRKRSCKPDELERYANMSENEWDEFLRDISDDDQNYKPSSECSDSSESSTQLERNEREENSPVRPAITEDTEGSDIEENMPLQAPDIDHDAEWSTVEEDPPVFQFDVPNIGLQTQDPVTIEYLVRNPEKSSYAI
ncbi:hypothetical protein FQR65_LT13790 [Abscondita terminalis]|nr:hypothetical protein FQR65_LT13790 [Abscondita terminalis]